MVCDGKCLQPSPVTSSLPQRTVLGLLLFLLYANDLPDNIQSSIRSFADDALLYGVIVSEDDCERLQDDLYQLDKLV